MNEELESELYEMARAQAEEHFWTTRTAEELEALGKPEEFDGLYDKDSEF